jgi:hypothetical protein
MIGSANNPYTSEVIVACRPAAQDEMPTAAKRLLAAALAAGWNAAATYAKVRVLDARGRAFAYEDRVTNADGVTGSVRDVHKDKVHLGVLIDGLGEVRTWEVAETSLVTDVAQEGKVVESIGLRLRRWPFAAAGEWWDGKFHHAYAWTAVSTAKRIGARDLARLVKTTA